MIVSSLQRPPRVGDPITTRDGSTRHITKIAALRPNNEPVRWSGELSDGRVVQFTETHDSFIWVEYSEPARKRPKKHVPVVLELPLNKVVEDEPDEDPY
jgi:hypothetical protein